ncbi:MAG: 50S ribosomal protein L6, partial [Haliea sp.]|nr:50S ribosomal protein L6 [Haliea sp.]
MSRVAKNPVQLPKGVEVSQVGRDLTVKGGRGTLAFELGEGIAITQEEGSVTVAYDSDKVKALAGTTRALLNNMVIGVSDGWEKKLVLNGVGYRAKTEGK